MNHKNKKTKNILTGCGIFCLIYIFAGLKPLASELHFTPKWTQNIFRTEEVSEEENRIPFKLGQTIGYFTEDGKIASTIPYPFKAAISSNYYCIYGASNSSADFFYSDGKKAGTINECGFPFFDQDRIFVFLPGGNSFVRCDEEGKRLWAYESYAPITAFSSSSNGTIAGYSDGKIVALNNNGRVEQEFTPGGSQNSVILGCDIHEDGKTVALVSGHGKQRFTVAEKNEGHTRIIFHEYLPRETNRQVLVKFNEENNLIYYGYDDGLGIVDLKKLKSKHIPIAGNIIQIEKSSIEGMIFVLSRKNNQYTVTTIENPGNKAAEFSYEDSSSFIQIRNDHLYVGRDDKVSLMTISRK